MLFYAPSRIVIRFATRSARSGFDSPICVCVCVFGSEGSGGSNERVVRFGFLRLFLI